MCGIYGSTLIYSPSILRKKLDIIRFRGPDYSDIKNFNNRLILGHNRLSIIDLDPRSNQPFSYLNLHITFNGEIYNYIEIKNELIKLGYIFKTTSDTEVICVSYIEWGVNCLQRFNGMFSFVIYDEKKNNLFGARDRLGKKPFYYIHNDVLFEFASQPSQLAIANNLTINDNSISQFLVWHYIPDPDTIYKEVKKLKAGHYFTFDLSSNILNITKYWDLNKNVNIDKLNYEDTKTELKYLLSNATSIRMISDVPLGVFLSGGIDSTLITALAQSQSSTPIKTFCVKFYEKSYNESLYAEKIANYLKTDHTTIECNYSEGISLIENLHKYYDEPFGDGSMIPTMLLAKHTRKHVTVALSGDGGDEGFLGYERYLWARYFGYYYNLPKHFKNTVASLLKVIPSKRLNSIGNTFNIEPIGELYKKIVSTPNTQYLNDPIKSNIHEYDEWLYTDKELLERISDYDIKSYLNNDINTKVDRATMAFSLESRSPFMDHRVIELSRTMPTEFKIQGNRTKRILKEILMQFLPVEYFDRPKRGFGMPLKSWFQNELKEYVYDNMTDKNLNSIPNINVNYVKNAIDLHMKNKYDNNVLIWDLLVLTQWLKNN